MTVCSNCGNENPDGSRFCANCGASLISSGRGAGTPPPPITSDRSQVPPTAPDWKMSDAGPLPPPPRRPRWLWFLLGTLGLCLLICGGLFVWANTIGYDTVQGFITTIEAVQTATAVAGGPGVSTPVPSGSPVAGGTPFANASPVAGSPLFAAGTPDGR